MSISKVEFLNTPRLDVIGDDEWMLTEPFRVRITVDDGNQIEIVVPRGFRTDLASVPRLPGAYLLFGGRGRRSAILHDYMYVTRWPRKFADEAFRKAMVNEANAFTRWAMWLGVRLGGGAYYDKHARPEELP